MQTNQNYLELDLGNGVTALIDPDRQFAGSSQKGAAYVYLNGEYRFTCADEAEATSLKQRALNA